MTRAGARRPLARPSCGLRWLAAADTLVPRLCDSESVDSRGIGHPRDRGPEELRGVASATLIEAAFADVPRRCESARPAVLPAAARILLLDNADPQMRLSRVRCITTSR